MMCMCDVSAIVVNHLSGLISQLLLIGIPLQKTIIEMK